MKRRFRVALVIAVVAPALIGIAAAREAAPPAGTGDPDLVAAVQQALPERGPLVVAVVTPYAARYAWFDAQRDDQYEIGSLTKLFTAELLVDAVDRQVVAPGTRLGALVPVRGEVANTTLEQLVTFTSGLGEWGPPENPIGGQVLRTLFGANPYGYDRDEMLRRANADPLSTRGSYGYSSLGFALLGEALATAQDTSYETLLDRRILTPLSLEQTFLATDDDRNLREGQTASGRRSAPWRLEAFAPAGGIRSTITDMVRWSRGVFVERSLTRRTIDRDLDGDGWGWARTNEPRPVTWASGEMGGFTSAVAVDTDAEVAVVVLSARSIPVDALARDLLKANR